MALSLVNITTMTHPEVSTNHIERPLFPGPITTEELVTLSNISFDLRKNFPSSDSQSPVNHLDSISNFRSSIQNTLNLITKAFEQTFNNSFAMNYRSVNKDAEADVGMTNARQSFIHDSRGGKFQKLHYVQFPNDFSVRRTLNRLTTFPETNSRMASRTRRLPVNSSIPYLPVVWTALSLALGVEVQGELIRGLPCISRLNQLFCRSGGASYPSDKIEKFIDDNKALIRRMYGDFISISVFSDNLRSGRGKRSPQEFPIPDDEYFDIPEINKFPEFPSKNNSDDEVLTRLKRQASRPRSRARGQGTATKEERVDSCLSEEEVATPYWASNSRGKIMAIVNINEFSQVIHQEICSHQLTKRCNGDCGCEQKYKYHRLMAYDPDNECKGIFMDWFLFPSCCSCRCDPL